MNQISRKVAGFTLVELMLAMAFISVLLIAIATTSVQISNIYNKGLTLSSVNQAGREISSSLKRDISASKPFSVTETDENNMFIIQRKNNKVFGGRLCTGGVSYVWNYGWAIVDSANDYNLYSNGTKVRLVRVIDSASQLCADSSTNIDSSSQVTELLEPSGANLALHNFSIQSAGSTNTADQALYAIHFTLGTNQQEAITTGLRCVPPAGEQNWEFCAINNFDVVVRAANSLKVGE